MINTSTIDKLIEMHMTPMADAFRIQMNDSSMREVPFEDRFGMLVDHEYTERKNKRLKRLIRNAEFARDFRPIQADCGCYACRNFSRAYIRHLYEAKEFTAVILLTLHNLTFYLDLMQKIRDAIENDTFEALRARYQPKPGDRWYVAPEV